jgi:uncharacterized repeat protein (TIGR02543 family)
LKTLTLSDACTTIGQSAFSSTSIRTFRVPSNLTLSINVFSGSPVETIELAAGYTGTNTIVDGVLFCNGGATLVAVPHGLDFYEVPETVTTLATGSLRASTLKNVVIGSGVATIESGVFSPTIEYIYFQDSDSLTTIANKTTIPNANSLIKVYYAGDKDPSSVTNGNNMSGKTEKVTGAANQFTITFNTNGGIEIDQIAFDVYLTETETMPTPVKAGSVFCGWYDDALLTSYAGTEIPMGTIGSKTFYAKWALPTDFVDGASVVAFSGSSAVIRIDAASVPEGNIIVTYSEFIDIAEGKILFPFLTGTVAVSAGNDTVAFTNDDGKAIESCSVTFRYTIGATAFYTPLSYANAPASSAKLDLTIDDGLTVTFDGNPVTNGSVVDFDVYQVSVAGGQTVVINGVVWTNGNRMFYGGQKLVVSSMA